MKWLYAGCLLFAITTSLGAAQLEDGLAAYEDGRYDEAFSQLEPAAKSGEARAQFCVGRMFERGDGTSRDEGEAAAWYEKAATQGDADAQCALGGLYEFGMGVTRSYSKAGALYQQAAAQGHEEATRNLRELEKRGLVKAKAPATSTLGSPQAARPITPTAGALANDATPAGPAKAVAQGSVPVVAPPDPAALLADMIAFRSYAAVDFANSIQGLPGREHLDFLMDNDVARQMPSCWSYFFAGSFVLLGATNSVQPVVAFYNPYLDGVLLTRWSLSPERGTRLESADFQGSVAFAAKIGGAARPLTGWLEESANKPLMYVLQGRMKSFVAAFAQTFPDNGASSRDLEVSATSRLAVGFVSAQSAILMQSLIRTTRPSRPEFSQALQQFKTILYSEDPQQLAGMGDDLSNPVVSVVAGMPLEVRANLTPYLLVRQGPAQIVLFTRQGTPRFVLAAYFDESKAKPLLALMLFDMTASDADKPQQEAEQQGTKITTPGGRS